MMVFRVYKSTYRIEQEKVWLYSIAAAKKDGWKIFLRKRMWFPEKVRETKITI
jgi:hypothetical protein